MRLINKAIGLFGAVQKQQRSILRRSIDKNDINLPSNFQNIPNKTKYANTMTEYERL
jgi:hypothetical protein